LARLVIIAALLFSCSEAVDDVVDASTFDALLTREISCRSNSIENAVSICNDFRTAYCQAVHQCGESFLDCLHFINVTLCSKVIGINNGCFILDKCISTLNSVKCTDVYGLNIRLDKSCFEFVLE
jgi:hypothetical protein